MSKKFYAINRETGKRWKSNNSSHQKQFLIMYDTGFLAEVTTDGWETSINPLDTRIWKTVIKENILKEKH